MKRNGILFIAVALLAGLLWYNKYFKEFEKEDSKNPLSMYAPFDLDHWDGWSFSRKDLPPVQLQKVKDQWVLVSQSFIKLKQERVREEYLKLFQMKILSALDPSHIPPSYFSEPVTWIKFETESESMSLEVSGRESLDGNIYLKVSMEKGSFYFLAEKPVDGYQLGLGDFVDTQIFEGQKVVEIEGASWKVRSKEAGVDMESVSSRKPWNLPQEKTKRFLERLNALEFQEAVSLEDLEKSKILEYGFDPKQRKSIRVTMLSGELQNLFVSGLEKYKNFVWIESRGLLVSGFPSEISLLQADALSILGESFLTEVELKNSNKIQCSRKQEKTQYFWEEDSYKSSNRNWTFSLKSLAGVLFTLDVKEYRLLSNEVLGVPYVELSMISKDSTEDFHLEIFKKDKEFWVKSFRKDLVGILNKSGEKNLQQLEALCFPRGSKLTKDEK